MLLPLIVALVSILALIISLIKDRVIEEDTSKVKRALLSHHLIQGILVLLALWAAYDAKLDEKDREKRDGDHQLALQAKILETKVAQETALEATLAAAMATSVNRHTRAIASVFSHELMAAGPLILRYASALDDMEKDTRLREVPPGFLKPFDPEGERQFCNGTKLFATLQMVAKDVIKDSALYGERYPAALTEWAEATGKLDRREFGAMLATPLGESYMALVEKATGEPVHRRSDNALAPALCG